MSLILRTLQAFPRGRTLEELHALLGVSWDVRARMAALAELEDLTRQGAVGRSPSGKWIALAPPAAAASPARGREEPAVKASRTADVIAAPFRREEQEAVAPKEADAAPEPSIDPKALLRYWRSALRSDPRGAITEAEDRHGATWHLIAGEGPLAPEEGRRILLTIELDALAPDFRAALLRREGRENALAVGWPMAVGRRAGVPAFWPAGLLAAEWIRREGKLEIFVSAGDLLPNPDWIQGVAGAAGWRAKDLGAVFAAEEGVGLDARSFLARLSDAAARQVQGVLSGRRLAARLNAETQGIFDAAALFLPEETSFTAGAVRDLDVLADQPETLLAQTALAPLLGLAPAPMGKAFPALNLGALNAEQIDAVRKACAAPLTVITGPPGTGKSQTIVSIAASVLAAGGSVLVASKNHQALDAVEDRLSGVAPEVPFLVRTLDPAREIDRSFASALTDLAAMARGRPVEVDRGLRLRLPELAADRAKAMDETRLREELEGRLAELHERIGARRRHAPEGPEALGAGTARAPEPAPSLIARLLGFLLRRPVASGPAAAPDQRPQSAWTTAELEAEVIRLRDQREALRAPRDLIALSAQIGELANALLPKILAARAGVSPEAREALDLARADLEFRGAKGAVSGDLARRILTHRPLWLASVLGAPRRIPLEFGLFDLVIFDEASQCDLASALPLFARARRAVVVGDDRQLNFIPQIGLAQDRNLMQAQGLPVERMSRFAQSRQSLFDFARRVPGAERILLSRQYRSAGPIVEYISESFYGGALQAAYDPSALRPPAGMKPGLVWTHVPAPAAPGAQNVNRAEVEAITAEIARLLQDEGYTGSLGVVSPFRAQALAVDEAVRSRIPKHKLEAAEFRAATVDGFQGQERDVIFFSPTLGASSPASALSFIQKDHRRLNVAISRARAVARIFGDLDFARSAQARSLARLAAAATEPRKRVGEGIFDSEWERILHHALKARGLDPQPQYEIAGRRLDFALFGAGGVKLDLEVDGRLFHETADGRRKSSDLWRDHQLKSLGWRVRRFWVDELAKDMEACLDLVERDLS